MLVWSAPTAATIIYSVADAELDGTWLADDCIDEDALDLGFDVIVLF